jgi:hypothetical protein
MLYNWSSKIVNQKQTLFDTSDYVVYNGFPIAISSLDGGTSNVTGYILPNDVSITQKAVRAVPSTGVIADLTSSDNRYVAQYYAPVVKTVNISATNVTSGTVVCTVSDIDWTFSEGDKVTITGILTAQGLPGYPDVTITDVTATSFTISDINTATDGYYAGLSGTATVTYTMTFPNPLHFDWVPSQGSIRSLYSFEGVNTTSSSNGELVYTYYPDLLDGSASHNENANANQLSLITPDSKASALTKVSSMSLANNQFFITNYNPFKIDKIALNDFTTLMVGYFDYLSDDVVNSTSIGYDNNFYGIFSETTSLRKDGSNSNVFGLTSPQHIVATLSVRYLRNGTFTLNIGDYLLTSLKKTGNQNNKPIIVGLTISQINKTATLILVDDSYKSSTVVFKRSIANPTKLIYGAAPFDGNFHAAKMYIMEINNYYSTKTSEFLKQEVQKMDAMYAITSGRTL